MKKILCSLLGLSITTCAFAWGLGHEDQIKLMLEKLPKEISSKFSVEQKTKLIQTWSHFPDGHKKHSTQPEVVKVVGKETAEFLDDIVKTQYFYHKDKGKCVSFAMLAKAFRENDYDAAAFFTGTLIHSVVDASAFNHGPLIHMLTYFQYQPEQFPKVELDLAVIRKSPEIQKRADELLYDFKPDTTEKNIDDIFLELLTAGYKDSAFMTSIEAGLVENKNENETYSKGYIETMAKIADHQVREGANLVCAAWAIAKSDQPLDFGKMEFFHSNKEKYDRPLKKIADKKIAEFRAKKILQSDSVYRGLLPNKKKYPAVAIVAEPSAEMDTSTLGFICRYISALCARTLKYSGENIEMVSLNDFSKCVNIDTKKFPVLVLCTNAILPNIKTLNKYISDGGKLVLIGGRTKGNFAFSKYLKKRPNNEIPATPSYGKSNVEEIKNMSVSFDGAFKNTALNKTANFKTNPNTPAGWGKPISDEEILTDNASVQPLAWLNYGKEGGKYCCAAAFKNEEGNVYAVYLPQYLLIPYLFASDTFKMQDWSRPELDNFSAPLFLQSIKLLSRH